MIVKRWKKYIMLKKRIKTAFKMQNSLKNMPNNLFKSPRFAWKNRKISFWLD